MRAVLFFLPFIMQLCSGALLPVPKCKLSDTECLKNSAQMAVPLLASGIPELKAEPLDVMDIDLIKVNLAGLNLVVTDAHVKGLKKAKIEKIRPLSFRLLMKNVATVLNQLRSPPGTPVPSGLLCLKNASVDLAKKQLKCVFAVDATMTGKYTASGQLLILPISGEGDVLMKVKNAQLNVTHQFEVVKNSEGKDIIKLKSFNFTYDVKDSAFFDLTGLFKGNKELSDAMLRFMNENWKVVSEEFGEPILRACIKGVHGSIKKYLQAHPLEELADL